MRRYKTSLELHRKQLYVSPGAHTREHTHVLSLSSSSHKTRWPVVPTGPGLWITERALLSMAPAARPTKSSFSAEEDDCYGIKGDRKTRKPLVEKKRRARINESLQELRTLLADTDMQSKMENAEVLELTVKRVENILRSRSQEADTMSREASERFAAGYIQCMHEVHTFVSTCPGIDATVAAELLNHLLECMPLNEDHLQDVIMDLMADAPAGGGAWPSGEALSPALSSPGGRSLSSMSPALSPSPSTTSTEDLCSDLEEADHERRSGTAERLQNTTTYSMSMWRPW